MMKSPPNSTGIMCMERNVRFKVLQLANAQCVSTSIMENQGFS